MTDFRLLPALNLVNNVDLEIAFVQDGEKLRLGRIKIVRGKSIGELSVYTLLG